MLNTTIDMLNNLNEENIDNIDLGIKRLRSIGLTEYALVTNAMNPNVWVNMHKYVPRVTDDATQKMFTGNTGTTLLAQSIDFVRHFYCQVLSHSSMASNDDIKILDYGCGWGRLLRLLPYYFPYNNILGVDPWDRAIAECEKAGILSPVRLIKRDASDLIDYKFDTGYAFSVFTHLPESLTKQVLKNIALCYEKDGLLIITIRPHEYWSFRIRNTNDDSLIKMFEGAGCFHLNSGFAYVPHGGVTGEYYGDTSMTASWFESNINEWKIIDTERSLSDSLQIYLTLQRV